MRTIFIILILSLSFIRVNSQTFLNRLETSDARTFYALKGNPLTLYHQTFEISQDSLTGEIIVGNEIDYFSDLSYLVNFTEQGNLYNWHYIVGGISSSSNHYFYDLEERYCNLQIMENTPISCQKNSVYNFEEPIDCRAHKYKLIQEYYSIPDYGSSIQLTTCDTLIFIEKDSILVSIYSPDADFRTDSYPIKDSLYYALLIDSCFNNQSPQSKTINLYNDLDQIVKIIEYSSDCQLPVYVETFEYDEQGMLVTNKRSNYWGFNELGEGIYLTEPNVDLYQYEYPEYSIDEYGNWRERYVFRKYQKRKLEPLYLESRNIIYTNK